MKNQEKFFSEYRSGDYRIARSLKELYGYEPTLWVRDDGDGFFKKLINRLMGGKKDVAQ